MKQPQELTPELKDLFEELKTIPPRDPQLAAHGRAKFLSRANSLRTTVSVNTNPRLSIWNTFTLRKDKFAMNAILALIIATALALGGAGTTAYAAQDDLPNDLLYPIKTGTEDFRLWLNTDPQTEIDMLMEMSRIRVQEMIALDQSGDRIPSFATLRLEEHIRNAFQIAAGLENSEMEGTLQQIRTNLQTQEQLMAQIQGQASPESNQLLAQTRLMLQTRIRLVDDGLAEPEGFRNTVRNEEQLRNRQQQSQTPGIETATPQAGPSSGNGGNPASGGNGPQSGPGGSAMTATPGNGFGPQPGNGGPGNGGNNP